MTRGMLLVLTALAIEAPALAQAAPGDDPQEKVFVGYLFGPPRDLNWKLYTHICHAFLTADETGEVKGTAGAPSGEVVASAHKAGVKVLLSLGGWGWDKQFAAIVSKPESEDRYVRAVMKIIDENDYDGIDLDWEYPDTSEEIAGFERLTRRFRKDLDALGATKGRKMLVTMAASGNPGTLRWLRKDFLMETMDWLNIMTYDFAGEWTSYAGHHSPLHASTKQPGPPRSTELSMKYMLEQTGLPANRLAVGIPLYGKGFAVSEPYANTKNAPKGRRAPGGGYANLHKLQQEKGWTRVWDAETKNPWLIAPDKSAVIGYDDAESIAIKTEWATKQGFRGVFFWQVADDRMPDGSNPLQDASRQKLNAAQAPPKR